MSRLGMPTDPDAHQGAGRPAYPYWRFI